VEGGGGTLRAPGELDRGDQKLKKRGPSAFVTPLLGFQNRKFRPKKGGFKRVSVQGLKNDFWVVKETKKRYQRRTQKKGLRENMQKRKLQQKKDTGPGVPILRKKMGSVSAPYKMQPLSSGGKG